MSANTLEFSASQTAPLGRSWKILYALQPVFVSSVVSICKRTWDVPKTYGGHHAWTWSSEEKRHMQLREKKKKKAAMHFPGLPSKDSHCILSNQKPLPMGTFITAPIKRTGKKMSFPVFTGKEWFPNYDLRELKRGNDLFGVNVKHMVSSRGFCPGCAVIALIWKRQIIKI